MALGCAAGSWLLGDGDEAIVLRVLVAAAAGCAVALALLLRRWDLEAGRQVARERAAKAGMSWQIEERQAELEEAQELVASLEDKIRDKRVDLGRLRSEHADLLRRYATAESERAKALEGSRRLALEAGRAAKALPAQATDHRTAGGAPTPLTYRQAHEAFTRLARNAARQREALEPERREAAGAAEAKEAPEARGGAPRRAKEPAPRLAPLDKPSREGSPRQRPQVSPPPQRPGGFDFFGTGTGGGSRPPTSQGTREASGRG
ncbi:hypothetical protein D7319_09835 [Streptomyces radicis]|uniref:Secreted protein n=1 Tax=Streptomyces radicis TaxID=1750517 RepID=A0A3A9WBG7_9ACTN|nr:hypothetical protein D7319_09835 [Streptomyces radicis]RKN24411.1 hypothetical protein D7318_11015 [Streptomyces radicis]